MVSNILTTNRVCPCSEMSAENKSMSLTLVQLHNQAIPRPKTSSEWNHTYLGPFIKLTMGLWERQGHQPEVRPSGVFKRQSYCRSSRNILSRIKTQQDVSSYRPNPEVQTFNVQDIEQKKGISETGSEQFPKQLPNLDNINGADHEIWGGDFVPRLPYGI